MPCESKQIIAESKLKVNIKLKLTHKIPSLPIPGIIRSLKHLWLISPIHLPFLSFLDIERMSIDLEGTLSGLLYIYRTASITTSLWSQMAACGWSNRLSKWESFRIIKYLRNIIMKAVEICDNLRPRDLTRLASEALVTHSVVPYLSKSFIVWIV